MNQNKLQDCSTVVRDSLKLYEEFYNETESYTIFHSVPINLLDKFDSEVSEEFLEKWAEELPMNIVSLSALENPDILYHLFDLINRYPAHLPEHRDGVEKILSEIRSSQQKDGRIMNDHHHQVRALVAVDPTSETTKHAVEYFFEEYGELDDNPSKTRVYNQLYFSIALMELDYDRYSDLAEEILRILPDDEYLEYLRERQGNFAKLQIPEAALIAETRLRSYSLDPELKEVCVENLVNVCNSLIEEIDSVGLLESVRRPKTLSEEDPYYSQLTYWARAVNGLLAAGQGYSVPGYEVEWQQSLHEQRQQKSKPEFLATLPATVIDHRRREILQKMEAMLDSVNHELRMSSLRIDMLHEEIIDLIEEEGTTVKVLTNEQSAQGERRKMANAVLNELVRRSEGAVKSDRLVHSRMMIVDESELLITSADITRDQLVDEFNAALYTRDPDAINSATEVFDELYEEAEYEDVN